MTPEARFLAMVEEVDGHWLWIGGLTDKGYAQFWVDGKHVKGHRWAYEHWIGPVPPGLQVDHVCRVRRCVRPHPEHLEAVTALENTRRSPLHHGAKVSCRRGHAYDEANTIRWVDGRRRCAACLGRRVRAPGPPGT